MGKQDERSNLIVELLTNRQIASISELAATCGVSEITVRRDLKKLQADGTVAVHGGVASLNLAAGRVPIGDKYFVAQQAQQQRDEKTRIARAAAGYLRESETIVIDMGSTPYFFARAIPPDLPLTVVCYSLNTFIELHERRQFTIYFAGGLFDPDSLICEGPEGLRALAGTRAHRAFITGSGFDERLGLTTSNFNEQRLKQTALEVAATRYLLLDSSKFGVVKAAHVANLDAFDVVITDSGISEHYANLIRGAGKQLIVV